MHVCSKWMRSICILYRCKINDNYSDVIFEGVVFMFIDFLQIIAYGVFIGYFCYYLFKLKEPNTDNSWSCSKYRGLNLCIVSFLLFVLCLLIFGVPIIGVLRDMDHIAICNKVRNNDTRTHNDTQIWTEESNRGIIWSNMAAKIVVCAATSIERILVVILISMSICKWDESSKLLGTANIKDVDRIFYNCYKEYIKVGNETKIQYKIFEAWFVIQYCLYLLSLLIETIHLVRPLYRDRDDNCDHDDNDNDNDDNKVTVDTFDLVHSGLRLLFDLLAFIIPFYMGNWLNYSHQKYHTKMLEACFEVKIGETTFYPGCDYEDVDDVYMKYYNLMSSKNLAKRADFDFVPSIFGISIPLDNQGYTFTILLSIISIMFNFAFLK